MIETKCNICGGVFSDKGMISHIKSCIQQKYGVGTVDRMMQDSALLLKVQAKYQKDYFLFLMADRCVLLSELDKYLRDIWLECCGHLSGFKIDDEVYASCADLPGERDMFVEVGEVLYKGLVFSYTYDYGSSTELELKVVETYEPIDKEKGIRLMARNSLPVYEDIHYKNMPNSPRAGVCGYEGPAEDIMFMKHKEERKTADQAEGKLTFIDKIRNGNITSEDWMKDTKFQEAIEKIMEFERNTPHLYSLPPFILDGSRLKSGNLTDCLGALRKNELDVIRKNLNIPNAAGMKKKDLVKLLSHYITRHMEEILAAIPYHEYHEIINISKISGPYINQPDESEEIPEIIDELRKKGLLFTLFIDSQKCGLFIPDDMKKAIARISKDSLFIDRRNLTRKINEILLGLFYYWGIAEKFPLMRETARLLEMPMDDSFINLFDRVFGFMCISLVISEKIGSIPYYHMFSIKPGQQVISSSWQNASYPTMTMEMLEPAGDGQIGLILDNPYYLELLNLMKEAGIDEEVGGEEEMRHTLALIAQALCNEEPSTTVRQIAKDLGFEIGLRKAPAFEELLNNLLQYTPNYWMKGNTLSGRMCYGARGSKHLDARVHLDSSKKESKKTATEKAADRWNVGRNDLCPCGSGKKYKKCCMKE